MPVTNETPLEVGQIIYILSNEHQVILPAIIHEETVVKTLEGRQVSWKVRVGPEPTAEEIASGQAKIMDINSVDGEIYLSLEEVKRLLTENFSKYIASIMRKAVSCEKEWYNSTDVVIPEEQQAPPTAPPPVQKVSPEVLMSTLPMSSDGAPQASAEVHRLQQLRENIMPSSEEMQQDTPEPIYEENEMGVLEEKVQLDDTIIGPDGQQIKVNLKF